MRFLAASLAALFFAGVAGTSDLDALLFHPSATRTAVGQPCVVPSDTGHHADGCLLTFRLGHSRLSPRSSAALRLQPIPVRRAAELSSQIPRRFFSAFFQRCRAPPTPLA
jgi:hypothetical protein